MLNEQQQKILEAVVNRVIPPDDDAGGWQGGVGDYLARQFERDLKPVVAMYEQCLLSIDAESNAAHGKSFADLAASEQDALLANIEKGQLQTPWAFDAAGFFRMLAEHSAEGFYSDPGNGGNHNGAAWKMIGFEVTA